MMAEDHHSARQAYVSALAEESNFSITGEAANGYELLKLVEKNEPHIVLVDVEMPVMDGFKTIAALKERFPNVKPIVLSMHSETHYVAQLVLCGARAYLPKSCHLSELITTINKVYTDGFYFSESLSHAIVAGTFNNEKFQKHLRHVSLNEQEIEVLKMVCNEQTEKQIATDLNISEEKINKIYKSVLKKTNSRSTIGLVKFAIRNGIIVGI